MHHNDQRASSKPWLARAGTGPLAALIVVALLAAAAVTAGCCEAEPEEQPIIPAPETSGALLPSAPPEPALATDGDEAPTDSKDYVVDKQSVSGAEQLPGPTKTIVPDVVGKTLSAAKSAVEAAGLKYYAIPRPQAPSRDHVAEQNPLPGTEVNTGSEVMVTHAP